MLMAENDRHNTKERKYTNGEITVYWRPSKCIHVTTCYRELIEVFNPRKRPWIDMKGASTEEIIRVVNMCPTDALTFSWNKDTDKKGHDVPTGDSRDSETRPVSPTERAATDIRVMKNGPLLVKGDFTITDADGNPIKKMKIATFCRCGQSLKMPFCDGTHRKINFSSV